MNTTRPPFYPRLWDAAVLVHDLEKARQQMDCLGFGHPFQPAPPEGREGLFYRGQPLASGINAFLCQIGNMQLEFIQPDDSPNPWKEYLETKGEGFHHLGFQVEDVEKEVERLTAAGAEVPFYGKINGRLGAAYVDLKVAGLWIELTTFCSLQIVPPEGPTVWDAAVLVKDIEDAKNRLEKFGIGPFGTPPQPQGAEGLFYMGQPLLSNSRQMIARYGGMQIELVQPDAKPNPWKDLLQTRGEGIHHLGFRVPDVGAELKRLTGLGAQVPYFGKMAGKIGAAYVDLKLANLFIELTAFGGVH